MTSDFARLGVPAPLAAVLAEREIHTPTPIQAATLPDSLAGRDVLGRGRTGSGKTLAFALPLVARLSHQVPSGASINRQTRAGAPRGLHSRPARRPSPTRRGTRP